MLLRNDRKKTEAIFCLRILLKCQTLFQTNYCRKFSFDLIWGRSAYLTRSYESHYDLPKAVSIEIP